MTSDSPIACPPDWAEHLLDSMLSSRDRESVSGDLLEEYRQSIVPALGAGANRWYVRQAVWYVLERTWMPALIAAALLVGRFVLDILAPIQYTPGVIAPRSAIMSDALMVTFVLSGAWHAWRTGHLGGGVLSVAVIASLTGILTFAGTISCVAIWHDPAALRAIMGSGGLGEAIWGMPILVTLLGTFFGGFGAIAVRAAAAIYGASCGYFFAK
jgi:hypothetical protein